jgi:hypothetical protein
MGRLSSRLGDHVSVIAVVRRLQNSRSPHAEEEREGHPQRAYPKGRSEPRGRSGPRGGCEPRFSSFKGCRKGCSSMGPFDQPLCSQAKGDLKSASQPKKTSVTPVPLYYYPQESPRLAMNFPCDTNPQILRFPRFLRVVLLVAAMPRCVAKVFVTTRCAIQQIATIRYAVQ